MEGLNDLWQKIPLAWRLAALGLLLALGCTAFLQARPDGRLHLYFLEVGQGNAVLLRTPSKRWILIDGGPQATALLEGLGGRLPFWQRELDLVLLTETAAERLAGPVAALERYRVRAAGRPGRVQDGPGWARWLELLAQQGVPALPLQAGARLELGDGLFLEVLYPGMVPLVGAAPGSRDDALVLRLRYGQFTALLPTAAGPDAQQALRQNGADLTSTLLLVPRQAETDALERPFLEAVRPALLIVSTGSGSRQGPDARTLRLLQASGQPLYRTDEQGTIEVVTDGRSVKVRAEREK
ncbi:MAG: hypothetical protein JXA37_00500 [Chloroflexia bacterium]|nr:hypothetical protein [Chloroflexia bacterium]